ncbi:MAG: hypothetical protein JXA91_02365 [Candidatus Thermoplasmatota archaeon]|nr:hypothetical protein [Candidatus Thermoplasmatota archaeon]
MINIKMKYREYFEFNNTKMQYFFHSYNNFSVTPRAIEIPLIKFYLTRYPHNIVLEIGNVTKHYYEEFKDFKKKDTLDKFEMAYDVINLDIKDYIAEEKYDFIYSISTFEHMDSDGGNNPDYKPIKDEKFTSYAFKNMDHVINNLLKEDGEFIITFPIGQDNCEIDNSLYGEEYYKFNSKKVCVYFFKKIFGHAWKQMRIDVKTFFNENPQPPKDKFLCLMEITK